MRKGWKLSAETKEKMRLSKLNERNVNWRGDKIDKSSALSSGLHEWVKYRLKKPPVCSICNKDRYMDLTNISGEYRRDLSDWMYMCRSCHMKADGRMKNLKQYRVEIVKQ